MKKIPTLFKRTFEQGNIVHISPEITLGCEWVLQGEGTATRKWDGTCVKIENNNIFRRYDCKRGRTPPVNFIPADNPDPITGHWPGWLPIDKYNPKGDEKFFIEGYINTFGSLEADVLQGTYELVGPKINSNNDNMRERCFKKHGDEILELSARDFNSIKAYLETTPIEGIVFHRGNGEMCKIKRSDFGFKWPV